MGALVKLQSRQPVLAVNNQIFFFRLPQAAHAAAVAPGFKMQLLRREQQDGAGDRRLRVGGLIKIVDGADLVAGKFALERLVAVFDLGDELGELDESIDNESEAPKKAEEPKKK